MMVQHNKRLLQTSVFVLLICCFTLPLTAAEESSDERLRSMLETDIDELGDIIVQEYISLASKRPEKVWETPAAAYVITATDISRSAATNIPDLLRMVPGMFVGNTDSSTWIVGARGLANEYGIDTLVLLDGRQVNFLSWGSVLWSIQDYPLEDIERIEIIRGPGGTLWGTNSGNGVINIITKHTKNTQGGLLSGIAGTDLYKGVFRHGGKMGEDAFYRVYGTYKDVDSFKDGNGNNSVDDWSYGKAGFRIDWQPSDQNELTFQGTAYQDNAWFTHFSPGVREEPFFPVKNRYIKDKEGLDLLVQWDHAFDDESKMKWLTYYDYFNLDNDYVVNLNYHTFKTDFEYQFNPFPDHEFIIGSGYRLVSDDVKNGALHYEPPSANDQTFTAFIQDDYTIIEDKLKLSLGSQFQYSDYSDFDYQPSAKLVYTPYEQYTVWTSVTRSANHYYRVMNENSFIFYALDFPYGSGTIPMLASFCDEGHANSENKLTFEIGQRLQATRYLSFEFSAFYNILEDHLTADTNWDQPVFFADPIPHLIVFAFPGNNIDGETYGVELAANANITDSWKLMASYSALDIQLHLKNNSNDFVWYFLEDSSPHHQFKINSYLDITKDVKLDASYYFVDEINNWGIPPHGRLDVRLGWEPSKQLEISLVGTNLLDSQTHEANGMYTAYTEVERGVYGKLTYRF